MPVEIKELHVKVTVNQPQSDGGEGSSQSVSENNAGQSADSDKLIADAVEQVFEIIDKKKER